MRRSPCSWVVTPSLNLNGVWCGLVTHPQATTPARCRPAAATRWVDGSGPSTNLCQPPRPTTAVIGDDNVVVSKAKLS
jgi:hypothetical protein